MTDRSQYKDFSGVLVVDKPQGLTSFDVVRRIKKLLGIKRVGHTGTLDPMATGVLTVCLNRATKLVPFLQAGEKEYVGRILLGMSTDTDDVTGRVTDKVVRMDLNPSEILKAAQEFVGPIEQVPPAYSAVKFDGRPAYKMARSGERIPPRSREVVVHDLAVTGIDLPRISFCVRVSKGTYIRSLAADLGRRLRTGACLETLRRVSAAPFRLDRAVPLADLESVVRDGRLEERLIPLENALGFMPEVVVSQTLARMVENGRPLPIADLDQFTPNPGLVRVMDASAGLLAVYEYKPTSGTRENQCLTPLRVLGRN